MGAEAVRPGMGAARRAATAWLAMAWVSMAWLAGGGSAPAQGAQPLTLHVYTNTIQLPVLVLSSSREPMAPIEGKRFGISLDGGPVFRPTHVRQEGDDPISLSIVMDMNGSDGAVLPTLEDAMGQLAPMFLRSKDHVSVYGIDCELVRFARDAPADPRTLRAGVRAALTRWESRRHDKALQPCARRVRLWDSLHFALQEMQALPGRRVLIALSNGRDQGSAKTAKELAGTAQALGVAIFGVRSSPEMPRWMNSETRGSEEDFQHACELSGGMVLVTGRKSAARDIAQVVQLVRGRYIVEFPRPARATQGQHLMLVTIAKSDAFIRPTGIAVPLPDPKVLADPTTIPSDPSKTPEVGTRIVPAHTSH